MKVIKLLFVVFILDVAYLIPINPNIFNPYIEYRALSPFEQRALLRQAYTRAKRSGSGDILNHIKSSIGHGLKTRLGLIAKGSASASSHFSSASGLHPHYYHPHHHHEGYKHPFDIWSFKKTVLYTLLQAIKAIKGGVIAIKGQIIKGGGHLLTAKGKLITGGGEALTNIGKNIATSAFVIIPKDEDHHHEEHEEHPDYHHHHAPPPSAYGHSAPSGGDVHSAPSAPGPEYGPTLYGTRYHPPPSNALYGGKHEPSGPPHHDGIIILKKIPAQHSQHPQIYSHPPSGPQYEYDGQETQTPDFKPLPDNLMHNLLGSMFHASSGDGSNEHIIDPTPIPAQSADAPSHTHKQSDGLTSPPGTNYGVPIGPAIRYNEYYNTNTLKLKNNQEKQETPMYVTPQPPIDKKPSNQIFIGMNVPLEAYQQFLSAQHKTKDNEVGTHSVIAQPNGAPTKFLIDYPDNKDLEVFRSVAYEIGPNGPVKLT